MKIYSGICIGATLLGVMGIGQAEAQMPAIPSSVLVCRAHQCAAASYSMTRGFLFNKVNQMMGENIGKKALICEADPISHVCLNEGIQIPAQAAFATTDIVIPSVHIVDTKLTNGTPQLNVVLDFQVQANQTIPRCEAVISRLNVAYVDKVEWTIPDFSCHITETGNTSMNASFNIDYIDFDYGFIGGYYTFGVGESVQGEKSGYVLMRLTGKNAQQQEAIVIDQIIVNQKIVAPQLAGDASASNTKTEEVKQTAEPQAQPDPVAPEVNTPIVPVQSGGGAAIPARTIQVTPIPRESKSVLTPLKAAGQTVTNLLYLETPKND